MSIAARVYRCPYCRRLTERVYRCDACGEDLTDDTLDVVQEVIT